ncbi:hypothetical protein G6F22_018354 [Rhizopus arrhizus]|nr:hypothetical protein G6F22_018354 [Rhizopus arrhizus]
MVGSQRRGDHGQVGGQFLRRAIRGGCDGAAAGQVLPRQPLRRGSQAGVDADQRAAVGLVAAVRGVVAAAVGECQQFRVGRDQQGGDGQFRAQRMDLLQIVFEQHRGLAQQRALQGAGIHVRVAVAVTADPAAHAQERLQRGRWRGEGLGGKVLR